MNDPDALIHFHGVNLSEEQVDVLQGLRVDRVDNYLIEHDPEVSYSFGWQMIERKAFFLRRTFETYPDAEFYILMDVDTLVVKPLIKLDRMLGKCDFAGIMTNPKKIMGGFLVSRNCPVMKSYWKELDEFLMDGGGFYYNKDQPAIFRLYNEYKKRIRFLPLPLKYYLDIWSKEDSYIWSAHKEEYGDKEERFKVYKEKMKEMEREYA